MRFKGPPVAALLNWYTGRVMGYLIGIDEAGRGALAGPVSVGAVLMPLDFDWREVFQLITKRKEKPKLRDSKQLTAQQRDTLYEYIVEHGRLRFAAALVGADVIDAIGIVNAAHEAAAMTLSLLGATSARAHILLDAGLKVPAQWQQEIFVRGDENVPAIALGSIIAKVTRDRYMEDLDGKYAVYHFDRHKGYGTLEHRRLIQKNGLSDIHRATFCGRFSDIPVGVLSR